MKIVVGSDHRGRNVCTLITKRLSSLQEHTYFLVECQNPDENDYPDVAFRVAKLVSSGEYECGILICGTGIGMCIAANKVLGIRAALCHNEVAAELSRLHNDANILCLTGDLLGEQSTISILEKWFSTSFIGGYHLTRIQKIEQIERQNRNA
ncbi:MAG: RpiB/LacA/LacB family sugar-phosphate isomerase [Thermoguttaceae bacterium]